MAERRPAVDDVEDGLAWSPRRRPVAAAVERREDAAEDLAQRILAQEVADRRAKLRVAPAHPALGGAHAPPPAGAEALLARVVDERGVVQHVHEAGLERTRAEVGLLAVA